MSIAKIETCRFQKFGRCQFSYSYIIIFTDANSFTLPTSNLDNVEGDTVHFTIIAYPKESYTILYNSVEYTKKKSVKANVSSLKALVTQASSAIPVMPLYISLIYKVMKEEGGQPSG